MELHNLVKLPKQMLKIIIKSFAKIMKKTKDHINKRVIYKASIISINNMRQGGVYTKLSKEETDITQEFWKKHFGRKINLKWHEYFYKVNGIFSPKYMPVYVKNAYIDPYLKDGRMTPIYSDKNMIDKLVGEHIKLPKTYIKNINGIFYRNNIVVSKEEAIEACQNIDDAIIKHSIDTCQGLSILRFKSVNGNVTGKGCPKNVKEMLEQYDKNFIVQDAIHQCEEMARLNPTSLNTIRIATYWSEKDGIVPLFAVVRMGRAGSVVDNASAGGLYCGINMDGTLKEQAYTLAPFSAHTETDNGVVFKGFSIPRFSDLKSKAVELHSYLPYTKLIGWDMCIDDNNEIELVEINAANPGMFQAATGPAFGDYTEEIIEYCMKLQK